MKLNMTSLAACWSVDQVALSLWLRHWLLVPNVTQYNKVELMKLILTGVTVVGHDSDIRILKESIEFIKKSSRFTDQYSPYK